MTRNVVPGRTFQQCSWILDSATLGDVGGYSFNQMPNNPTEMIGMQSVFSLVQLRVCWHHGEEAGPLMVLFTLCVNSVVLPLIIILTSENHVVKGKKINISATLSIVDSSVAEVASTKGFSL